MKHIIHILFASAILTGFSSCSWLDEPAPKGQISTDKLTGNDLKLLTNGVLHQYEAFLNNIWTEGDYLAENYTGGPGFEYADPHGDTQSASAEIPRTRWQYCYNKLNYANLLIDSALKATDQESADVKEALGTGYFFRAWVYFNLVERYGGVPKITVAGSTAIIPRSSEEEIWQFIMEDLKAAEKNLNNFTSFAYPSKELCWAFQARVALWCKDYSTAVSKADDVLNSNKFTMTDNSTDFASMFINGTRSKEIIFAPINIRSSDYIKIFEYTNDTDGSYKYSPTEYCYNHLFDDSAIKSGDIRKAPTFSPSSPNPVIKFPNGQGGQFINNPKPAESPLMCMRLSDVYLTKAEAQWADGSLDDALSTLSVYLAKRYENVNLPASMSKEELEALILDENRREFFAEGHRWFDVKRIGLNQHKEDFSSWIESQYNEWNNRDFLIYWPIPQVERDKSHGVYTQNPGYSGYQE